MQAKCAHFILCFPDFSCGTSHKSSSWTSRHFARTKSDFSLNFRCLKWTRNLLSVLWYPKCCYGSFNNEPAQGLGLRCETSCVITQHICCSRQLLKWVSTFCNDTTCKIFPYRLTMWVFKFTAYYCTLQTIAQKFTRMKTIDITKMRRNIANCRREEKPQQALISPKFLRITFSQYCKHYSPIMPMGRLRAKKKQSKR